MRTAVRAAAIAGNSIANIHSDRTADRGANCKTCLARDLAVKGDAVTIPADSLLYSRHAEEMMADIAGQIRAELRESARVKESFSEELVRQIARCAEKCASAIQSGGKIVFFGNGGSMADAQHLAAELIVRLERNRPGIAALSLATNTSVLTAAANDLGFEHVFSRQIESMVSEKDVLVALSTSGNSANILRGADAGRARGAFMIGMTGETGGKLAERVDLLLNVPSRNPQHIQEAHITIGHIVCALIEQSCFPAK